MSDARVVIWSLASPSGGRERDAGIQSLMKENAYVSFTARPKMKQKAQVRGVKQPAPRGLFADASVYLRVSG